jgi:hypothetical protein
VDPAVELEARSAYEAFTDVRALQPSDVVVVPTWTPHSLQHGVRVVEFQSPTYERYIIAFAQKVLTQNHWDSEYAIANMSLDTPAEPVFEPLGERFERIARFDQFNVCRGIATNDASRLPTNLPYALIVALDEPLLVRGLVLEAEQAAFVSHSALPSTTLRSKTQSRYLAAAPGL